ITLQRAAAAVRAGDVGQVRKLLDARPDLVHVDMADNDERRLLHLAVLARDLEMTRLLLRYGADAHKGIYPHRDATTALVLATDRGYDEIVDAIRANDASQTPGDERADIDRVVEAIARGDRAAAITLLEQHRALVDRQQRHGWTPLHAAAAVLDEPLIE